QPHGRHIQDAAEPPHHQARLYRRGTRGWPVRRRLENAEFGPRRGLVQVPAGVEGSRGRLGEAQVRQLQYGDQEVRWRRIAAPSAATKAAATNAVSATSVCPPPPKPRPAGVWALLNLPEAGKPAAGWGRVGSASGGEPGTMRSSAAGEGLRHPKPPLA